ncbi:MAG: hypothetical protein GY798_23890, partial [Hyphomicrobiales bacterium]|nr:hypothetical protein [Hyphomicrobiales bacterium]
PEEPSGGINDEDQAIADAAVLTIDDFEPGWREEEPRPESDLNDDIEVCAPSEEAFDAAHANLKGTSFAGPGNDRVGSRVDVFATEAEAEAAFDTLASDTYAECLDQATAKAMREAYSEDPTMSERIDDIQISIGRASTEDVGDEVIAYQFEIAVEGGFGRSLVNDFVAVRVGRAVGTIGTQSPFGPLFGLQDHVGTVVANLEGSAV